MEEAFTGDIDYAMLVKLYGSPEGKEGRRRYSPAECTREPLPVYGSPDPAFISASVVEIADPVWALEEIVGLTDRLEILG